MTKMTLRKAEQSVIRAAIGWVNYEDDGLVPSLAKQVRVSTALVNSVDRLKKARKQHAKR